MARWKGNLMKERSQLMEWMRGEIVGPSRPVSEPAIANFTSTGDYLDATALRRGPLAWKPDPAGVNEEVLYYERESPHRKYGVGLLHPTTITAGVAVNDSPDKMAL